MNKEFPIGIYYIPSWAETTDSQYDYTASDEEIDAIARSYKDHPATKVPRSFPNGNMFPSSGIPEDHRAPGTYSKATAYLSDIYHPGEGNLYYLSTDAS
ncbi:hypothetical protein N6H14_20380 [Paenibacillus sp. CC-CFT747]|nr:hypothetical protein N6H14_20380 [Paenibacillus sp. CC-CFT747]